MSGFSLVLDDLSFGYAEERVIHGVSLEVQAGEFVALVGPNGSGKSTLLKLMLGTLRPQGGRVLLKGRPLEDWPRRQVARMISYVPQDTQIPFPFLVEEVVMMGRHPWVGPLASESAEDRSRVAESMRTTGVAEFRARSVQEVSGGERQRVILARALAQQACAIVLDEPTANLDVGHQLRILEILRSQAGQGCAVVVSMHDLNLAARFASRLILLGGGRIVAEGSAEDVLAPDRVGEIYGVRVAAGRSPLGNLWLEFKENGA